MAQSEATMMLTPPELEIEDVMEDNVPQSQSQPRSRLSLAAKAALGASLVVAGVVGAWQLQSGHQSAGLADFRRFEVAKDGLVKLDGEMLDPVKGVNCFLDNGQLIFRTMAAILLLRSMPEACADLSTPENRGACTVAFNGGFLNMVLIATMIAAAVNDCANTVNVPAGCTAITTGFMASLQVLPTGIGATIANCDTWWKETKVNPYGVATTKAPFFTTRTHKPIFTTRAPAEKNFPTLIPAKWLEMKEKMDARADEKEAFGVGIAFCMVDVFQSMLFLGRAVMTLLDSAKWCTPTMQTTIMGKEGCAADILNFLAAISNIANFLADAVPSCGQAGDVSAAKAACAAGIILIPEAIFAVAGTAIGIPDLCPSEYENSPPTPVPIITEKV
eukprot:CAMPEP_0206560002 /NCGR_PEP_ID=MMETSP0325_2-20121206/20750_1 /ASSEMBLY_ACC=CAM_ASM_000347 /TAXON_ID=2866 /ORGANISM="Crypthecodinium cohnii, Strain Seligo" /LENGTH=388 /DNA_ID=CAMNT_0054061651 /DNA_START=100 /DNA_END=1266 /DNA_ORIENTATION=-